MRPCIPTVVLEILYMLKFIVLFSLPVVIEQEAGDADGATGALIDKATILSAANEKIKELLRKQEELKLMRMLCKNCACLLVVALPS